MPQTYGFYNAKNHDRRYDSVQVGSMFDGVITDGVFLTISAGKNIMPFNTTKSVDNNMVTVDIGKCWFNRRWLWNSSKLNLWVDAPRSGYRTAAVVVEINYETRVNELKIVYDASTHGSPLNGVTLKPFAGSYGVIKPDRVWRYLIALFDTDINGVRNPIKMWVAEDEKCPVVAPAPPMVSFNLDGYLGGLKQQIENFYNTMQQRWAQILNDVDNISNGSVVTINKNGLVPKLTGNGKHYFAGDGTWKVLPDAGGGTTYSVVTAAANGLIKQLPNNGGVLKSNAAAYHFNGQGQWVQTFAWDTIKPPDTAYGTGNHWFADAVKAINEENIANGGGRKRITIPYGAWDIVLNIECIPSNIYSPRSQAGNIDMQFSAIIPNKPTTTNTSEENSPPVTNIGRFDIVPITFGYYYSESYNASVGFVLLKKGAGAQQDRWLMIMQNWCQITFADPQFPGGVVKLTGDEALSYIRLIVRARY